MGRDDSLMEKPELDAFGREYARLSFAIERHVPGFIDAYLGPDDVRAELDPDDPAGALPALRRSSRRRGSSWQGFRRWTRPTVARGI